MMPYRADETTGKRLRWPAGEFGRYAVDESYDT